MMMMGHLVNPTAFRLVKFNNWLDTWMTSSSYYYAELLHCSFRGKRILMYYMENLITDKYGILYSHMVMQEVNKHSLFSVYFYDGLVEQKLQKLTKQIRKYNGKTKKFESKFKDFFLRKIYNSNDKNFFIKKIGFYNYFLFKKIFLFFFFFLINFLKKVRNISFFLKKKIKKFYSIFAVIWKISFNFLKKKRKKENSIFFVAKIYLNILKRHLGHFFYKNFRLSVRKRKITFNFFFIFFKELYNVFFYKTKFFQLYLTHKKILYSVKYNFYLNYLNQINEFVLTFVTFYIRMYLMHFRQRVFFKIYFYILKPLLQRVSPYPVTLEFYGLDNDTITASFLARYLTRKIEMRFSINELFKPIARELKTLRKFAKTIYSFKIQFVGRLTRRDRVVTKWLQFGGIPYSTVTSVIEHSLYTGILRNGICCLRVWFNRPNNLSNYNYIYRYILKEKVLKKTLVQSYWKKKNKKEKIFDKYYNKHNYYYNKNDKSKQKRFMYLNNKNFNRKKDIKNQGLLSTLVDKSKNNWNKNVKYNKK